MKLTINWIFTKFYIGLNHFKLEISYHFFLVNKANIQSFYMTQLVENKVT